MNADAPHRRASRRNSRLTLLGLLVLPLLSAPPVWALSELKPASPAEGEADPATGDVNDGPGQPTDQPVDPQAPVLPGKPALTEDPSASDGVGAGGLPPLDGPLTSPGGGLPDPGPLIRTPEVRIDEDIVETPDAIEAPMPLPAVLDDLALLPEPVRRLRALIIAAAETGEPEQMRALLGTGPTATRLSLNGSEEDAVDYLKSLSGDEEGQEVLAILLDILNTGFVRVNVGTDDEAYIWPYHAEIPIETLVPAQRVDLLRIVTAGDVEDMTAYGSYNFFRIAISPEGEWLYFMVGN